MTFVIKNAFLIMTTSTWLLLNTEVFHSCKNNMTHQQICGGNGGAVLRDFMCPLASC